MEQYTTRSMANNTIKINCTTPDTYRKLVKFMNENNIIYHTYQPKEKRAYRVITKYLLHSIDGKEVAAELFRYGHKVRNKINVRQRQTKEPLNLFFVDLEPADNSKDIYIYNPTGTKQYCPDRTTKSKQKHCPMPKMPAIWPYKNILQQTLRMRKMRRTS